MIASPMVSAMKTATMMRADLSASHRISSTIATVPIAVDQRALLDGGEFLVGDRNRPGQAKARLDSRISGWHRQPPCAPHRSPAGRVRARCNPASARYRRTGEDRSAPTFRPVRSSCQEKLAGRSAATSSSVLENRLKIGASASRLYCLRLDPAERGQRSLRQATPVRVAGKHRDERRRGLQLPQRLRRGVSTGRNSSALVSKNSPPSGRRTEWNRADCVLSLAVSASAPK